MLMPLLLLLLLLVVKDAAASYSTTARNKTLLHHHRLHCSSIAFVSVDDFGAQGNGLHDDTKAFEDAWKFVCSIPTKAVLEVPYGNVYLVGPINFSGPCKSRIVFLIKGTIVAPPDPHVWDGIDTQKWLYFQHISRLLVSGGGTIDGMGHEWWKQSCKVNVSNPCIHAPMAVTFYKARHLRVKELTLKNSQQMHMTFAYCKQVKASRLNVIAPSNSPNTDGIHINHSISVVVENCQIRTGDDCISIISNSSRITIRNIACGPGHGISIGSLGKNKSVDVVRDVLVDGAFITNTENGVRIKSWQGGGGYARNIVFRDVSMKNVSNPIIINQYYCDSRDPCPNQTVAVQVERVSYIRIKGTSATKQAIKFACSDTHPCKGLYLNQVFFSRESGSPPTAYCWKASAYISDSVYPRPPCLTNLTTTI